MRSLRASVDEAVDAAMRGSHDQVLSRFVDGLPDGRSVQGMPTVKEMLAAGRVEVLLLAADRSADPRLWGSRSDPMLVATDPAALGAAGGDRFEAPAAALLLRAAAEGGAQFTELLPGTRADDGVGAILRY
jgi:hypothetical protein